MTKLYVDLTTASQEAGRVAHGTTRVERGLAAAFAALGSPEIAFVRFERRRGGFTEIPRAEAAALASRPARSEKRRDAGPSWRASRILEAGRALERLVRSRIRDPVRSSLARWRAPAASFAFAPGATLLIAGELQRQDMRLLTRLNRSGALRLAFIFHDLHDVLPQDDPRLTDLEADLPSTDFMVREASSIFANSRFSAGELVEYLQRRGIARPPVHVFRLGHDLTPGGGAVTPVPGIEAPFVLTVGDVVERKNHALLLRVWRRLAEAGLKPPPLVIVGKVGREGSAVAQAVAAMPDGLVRLLPNVGDEGLRWLYANCLFTVFPSLAEGYGLPVGESLAFGKVCIASSATAIPEASQGLAIHLDPQDEDGWVRAVGELIASPARLAQAEAALRVAYRPFTWSDAADDILTGLRQDGLLP